MPEGRCLSRREVLGAVSKSLLGVGLCRGNGPRTSAIDESRWPPYSPFKLGFDSHSLRCFVEPDEFVKEARRLNVRYVELWAGHLAPSASPDEIRALRNKLMTQAMKIAAFGVERFTADHARNERIFRFGRFLGLENLNAYPTRDALPSLERLVCDYSINVAIQNHGFKDDLWGRPEGILEAVGDLDPRIGARADLGSFLQAGIDPLDALDMLGPRVLGCQLTDCDRYGHEVVLGDGRLDLRGALRKLRRMRYTGPLSVGLERTLENPIPQILHCLCIVARELDRL